MVYSFPSQAARKSPTESVGFWCTKWSFEQGDSGNRCSSDEEIAKFAIPVSNQEPWKFSPRRSFAQLLSRPLIGGRFGCRDMHNTALFQCHDNEDIHGLKQPVIDDGKITGPNLTGVIAQEGSPILTIGRCFSCPIDIFLNGPLAQRNSQFEQFPTNSRGSPETVFKGHLIQKANSFERNSFFLSVIPRLESPKGLK